MGWGAGLFGRSALEVALLALMAGAAGVLVVVDLAEHRLPDTVVLGSAGVWVVGLLPLAASTGAWGALVRAVASGLGLLVTFLVLALLARGALGLGDVKLAALLGAVLGWFGGTTLAAGLVAGILLHGLAAAGVLIATGNPKADVPMGPALIAGALLGLGWGEAGASVLGLG